MAGRKDREYRCDASECAAALRRFLACADLFGSRHPQPPGGLSRLEVSGHFPAAAHAATHAASAGITRLHTRSPGTTLRRAVRRAHAALQR